MQRLRYIFNSSGKYVAFVSGGNVFSPASDWLAFVREANQVYNTDGRFMGYILEDGRIARRSDEFHNQVPPPMRPLAPLPPLPPLERLPMIPLLHPYVDVFESAPSTPSQRRSSRPRSRSESRDYSDLLDSKILAADGTFLGRVSNSRYDRESILNQYGEFGSKYSRYSIFNEYGQYGGKYSSLSPYNEYSSSPPHLDKGGRILGRLTVNRYVPDGIPPDSLIEWLRRA